jgi:uncharacterized protein YqcC (DUF446 family)
MNEELLAKLDEIEAEMKKIGIWYGAKNHKPISPNFDWWLQNTFQPNARASIQGNRMPAKSQVAQMAMLQYGYQLKVDEALRLIDLLSQFDKLVESRASAPLR